jgi:hypothetical protein
VHSSESALDTPPSQATTGLPPVGVGVGAGEGEGESWVDDRGEPAVAEEAAQSRQSMKDDLRRIVHRDTTAAPPKKDKATPSLFPPAIMLRAKVWKAATSKTEPRQKQDWVLKYL